MNTAARFEALRRPRLHVAPGRANRRPGRCLHPRGGSPAFSLVELVLVMTVIATLSAVAVPRFAAFLCNQRLEAAARRITVDLAYGQERARHASTTCRVQFNAPLDLYTMDTVTNPDHPGEAYIIELAKEPYQVDVISADFGGDAEIAFDAYGKSDSGGTIVLRCGARTLTVTIDARSGKALFGVSAL